MELRDINAFLTVCEELHFTRAAARLRIAQSGVSQAIKRLEAELGVKLLARSKRRVTVTEAGEAFRAKSRSALRELADAGVAARRTAAGLRGQLRVQFGFMTMLTVVPAALARFKREYPEVEVELEPAGTEPQIEALRLGRCDIGFMSFQHQLAGIGEYIGVAGEHLTGAEMARALSHALERPVVHRDPRPAVYRSFGFPGADDLGNMFQYNAEFEAEYCGARSVAESRPLNPELMTFAAWLSKYKSRIPLS